MVHIAGELDHSRQIQLCARCGLVLVDAANALCLSGEGFGARPWPVGGFVGRTGRADGIGIAAWVTMGRDAQGGAADG